MFKKVDWPGYVVGSGDDILDSGGCGPCTAIAIVDRGYRSAVLLHILDPEVDQHIIDEMLLAARAAIPELVDAMVQVVGAGPDLDAVYGPGECLRVRARVLMTLQASGIPAENIRQSWNEDESIGKAIVVDLGQRKTMVETFSG